MSIKKIKNIKMTIWDISKRMSLSLWTQGNQIVNQEGLRAESQKNKAIMAHCSLIITQIKLCSLTKIKSIII